MIAINLILIIISLSLFKNTNAVVDIDDRLDCVIENKTLTDTECLARGCVWKPVAERPEVPVCYFDRNKVGYVVTNNSLKSTSTGFEANLVLKDTAKQTNKFVQQLESLKFEAIYLTENIVRFKLYDPNNKRYEVPVQSQFPLLNKQPALQDVIADERRQYVVTISDNNSSVFHFDIKRKNTNAKLFDSSIGGLIFSDQFIQIASYLPTDKIYGLGENLHHSFRHNLNYKTWPLFAKEQSPYLNFEKNSYGVHPFYTGLEVDGTAHGLLFLNSNAMDYTLLPSPALSFKTVGGILDFFLFVGRNPEHVIQLYTSLIGRPYMPAFWSLGFQLCKYGYHNTSHVEETIYRQVEQKIPYDVQYVDSDYKNVSRDFTLSEQFFSDLPQLIAKTKAELNLRWIPIIDPAIQANDSNYAIFTDGYREGVFVKWPENVSLSDRKVPAGVPDPDIIYGRVWPDGPAGYPDYFKNATQNWWVNNFRVLYHEIGWKFDGLWIDMNEPMNFDTPKRVCPYHDTCYALQCPQSRYDDIGVKLKVLWAHDPTQRLSTNTLCMTGIQGENDEYIHYDVHSLYGWSMTLPSLRALHEITGKRGFLLSRSTYVSSGAHTSHWLGDNSSLWPHMKDSIIGILEFNLFGIPFVGADICGFFGTPDAELCLRWSQLGAFYPFSRNHKDHGVEFEQDPAVWVQRGHPEVTEAARNALYMRYRLLPYLNTLFYRSHVFGDTVARALFHEYPTDNNTHDIDEQFMWGSNMIISPFLYKNQTEVNAYLPDDVWYEPFEEFVRLHANTGYVTFGDSQLHPPIHFRGGAILPVSSESKAVNTKIIQQKPIRLHVFPKDKHAFGQLFWDDGESIDTIENRNYNYYQFNLFSNCSLEIKVLEFGYNGSEHQLIDKVFVANTRKLSEEIVLKANVDGIELEFTQQKEDYTVLGVDIDLNEKKVGDKWLISWNLNGVCNLN